MRSSVPPLARMTFCGWDGSGDGRGDSARHLTAEAWAWNRKVSANCTSSEESVVSTSGALEELVIVAVMPCKTRSYEPVTIWTVTGVDVAVASSVEGFEGSVVDLRTLRGFLEAESGIGAVSLLRFVMTAYPLRRNSE